MVVDHWFRQIEKILEAMEITSDVIKIRLTAFQLKGESQQDLEGLKGNDMSRVP